jgi:NitT/TauT family transport system permease protein
MLGGRALWGALGRTLMRLAGGVLLGGSAGLATGWLMGASRPLRVALDPIVATLHPLPKLAIFPLFMILLGIGEASKVALLATVAYFPILINTLAGVQQIDHLYREAAVNYGATGFALLRRVIFPGSLPMALAGLRLSFNSALVVVIAVEMLSSSDGLGAMIWLSWQTMRLQELYATLVLIALLGLGFNTLLARATALLVPWQVSRAM